MKLWGGRFSKTTHPLVDRYTASIPFDYQLAEYDIQGSIAHVQMLKKCQLLNADDTQQIIQGLTNIAKKIQQDDVEFSLQDEDIHMNIERLLHQQIGDVAGKLHTGRSRNDQVALDLHLYLRQQTLTIIEQLVTLEEVFLQLAKQHTDTIMPGYTHLQRAEPVSFAQHMLAYAQMFGRDIQRLADSFKRINISPLGAGALAGSGVAVDPLYVAELLKFDNSYINSLDAVSDRDFIVEFLSDASLIMLHIAKLSEEIVLWNSQEFNFIQLDDAFCTGSSMMPQKKNPDVAELGRGKCGRVFGSLFGLLTTLKGLPLAYNKDLQEDKEGLFDTVNTIQQTLSIYAPMLSSMQINKNMMHDAACNDYANATQLANYLVAHDVPFRQAHAITGKIVLHCIEKHCLLQALALEEYQVFHPAIADDVYEHLTVAAVIATHNARGGTSTQQVLRQIEETNANLQAWQAWHEQHVTEILGCR